MSDNHESGPVSAVDAFYPEETVEPLKPTTESEEESADVETSDGLDDTEVEAEVADDAESDDAENDAEELDESDGEDDDTEEETLYLDLDGEEFNLDEVRDWKAGHMMQADYTKKTQLLADDRNALEAERTDFNSRVAKVSNLSLELEALVAEDEVIDWAELKEVDIEEYVEKKERADKRKAKVAELKSNLPTTNNVLSDAEVATEQKKLLTAFPSWVKDGKPTDAYTKDMEMVFEYAKGIGYTDAELNSTESAHNWIGLIAAANAAGNKSGKKSALDKKVRKAPLVTRPKKVKAKKAVSAAETFYGVG